MTISKRKLFHKVFECLFYVFSSVCNYRMNVKNGISLRIIVIISLVIIIIIIIMKFQKETPRIQITK